MPNENAFDLICIYQVIRHQSSYIFDHLEYQFELSGKIHDQLINRSHSLIINQK